MFKFLQRIKAIEERIDVIERKNKCANGWHEWEVCYGYGTTDLTIRCKHCYAPPKKGEGK